jgi:hypothetical protein
MVKTNTNPTLEVATAAQLATDRANRTNDLDDVDKAVFEWERVMEMMPDSGTSKPQAIILAAYASTLYLRWSVSHHVDDLSKIVFILNRALEKSPQASKTRYDLLTDSANAYASLYQESPENPQFILNAINRFEEAYGMSVTLHCMKEAVIFQKLSTILPLTDYSLS